MKGISGDAGTGQRIQSESGAVALFLLVVLVSLILFLGLLIDLLRIRIAQNQLERAAHTAGRSVLADYNTPLRSRFGLYSMNNTATSEIQSGFSHYLTMNLPEGTGNGFHLLDFRVERASINGIGPMADPHILTMQILEDTKIRAPVDLTRSIVPKIRQLSDLFRCYDRAVARQKGMEKIDGQLNESEQMGLMIQKKSGQWKKARSEKREAEARVRALREERQRLIDEIRRLPITCSRKYAESKRQELIRVEAEIADLLVRIDALVRQMKSLQSEVKKLAGDSLSYEKGTLESVEQTDARPDAEEFRGIEVMPGEADDTTADAVYDAISETELRGEKEWDAYRESVRSREEKQNPVLTSLLSAQTEEGFDQACTAFQPAGKPALPGPADWQSDLNAVSGEIRVRSAGVAGDKNWSMIREANLPKSEPDKAEEAINSAGQLFSRLKPGHFWANLRNELFINEFVLGTRGETARFDNLAMTRLERGDAETVLCGSKIEAVRAVWRIRFMMDAPAYYVLVFRGLGPFYGVIASAAAGGMQAGLDVVELLNDREIGIVEVVPARLNPLNRTVCPVTYIDCLRLAGLMRTDKQEKMDRLAAAAGSTAGINMKTAYTAVHARVEVSVRLWFLPLAGMTDWKRGPFGTKLKGGRCYLESEIECGY